MFRTAVLRSTAAAVRSAARPISNNAVRRLAIGVAAPRVSVFSAPKVVAWQSVRCYASGGGLDRKDVYDRIKQLLAGFDKVRSFSPLASRSGCVPPRQASPVSGTRGSGRLRLG
jgi:NADH dehydrogenase (ubiquinone) 1 alpha/beta subcomplex 1, acyl-carrier protein